MLMVSHVDDDHIQGILDLTKELNNAEITKKPQLVQVLSFWHNSFNDMIGQDPKELTGSVKTQFGTASVSGSGDFPEEKKEEIEDRYGDYNIEENEDERREIVFSSLKVLASIEQGFRLRLDTKRLNDKGLGFDHNPEFYGKLIMTTEAGAAIPIGQGLNFTVIGPMQAEVKDLFSKHQNWLRELKARGKSPPEALAAYVDKSIPNLSSIVVLAEAGGKKMLLTGDARGDKILQGLHLANQLEPGSKSKIKVDLLKVPHHGSANNLDRDFFERVIADHYIFSGDGEHGNPEREAIEMLFKARGDEPFTVHLTYPFKHIDEERRKDWEKERKKQKTKRNQKKSAGEHTKIKVKPEWLPMKHSLAAFFNDRKFAAGQKIEIVPEKGPHVIDLLDRLGF
jgi:hypothetical protein